MSSQSLDQKISNCNKRLNILYTRLGQVIYSGMEDESLFYRLISEDEQLGKQAKNLLRQIKYGPSNPKDKAGEIPVVKDDGVTELYARLDSEMRRIKESLCALKNGMDGRCSAEAFDKTACVPGEKI